MESVAVQAKIGFNVSSIREDFPLLQQLVHGKPLIYLDSTATSQKPEVVIRAMDEVLPQV